MALSGAIGQATSGNNSDYYIAASHTGKGVLTSILLRQVNLYGTIYSGNANITVRIILDGVAYYINAGHVSYQSSTATVMLSEAGLSLKNIKLPYASSMSVAVTSAPKDSGYFTIEGTVFYVKEV